LKCNSHQAAARELDGAFELQQFPLSGDASCIASKSAVLRSYAMARRRNGRRVGGASLSDSPRGGRLADAPRDLRVGERLSSRDLPQRCPHALLKLAAANV